MDIYLTTAYLAPVQYYTKFLTGDKVFIEQNDNYVKQTYRNRCTIVSANGPISLSIPVVHSSSEKVRTKDIRIADHGNWRHIHWNAIVSAYNSTPFFEFYRDDFYPFFHKKTDFLFDFNNELQSLIVGLLNIEADIFLSDEYRTALSSSELDMRESIHPKKDWRTDPDFTPARYYQVFEQKFAFIENMSIIDLLFNMGNEGLIVLHNSIGR
jgi:hypothetical protein